MRDSKIKEIVINTTNNEFANSKTLIDGRRIYKALLKNNYLTVIYRYKSKL